MEPARIRASPEQISAHIEYMERHGDLSRPQAGSQGRLKSMQLWAELTAILNSMGSGVERSQDRWKKIWADWKNKAKKKLMNIRRQANATGGGPSCRLSLTAMEIRIVHIIGEAAVVGQRGVQEHGFNTQSQPIEENPQQGGAEIVVELQDFNCTDSRVGFGFAFGNHADFQVMFELGPQTNTIALNGQGFPANAPSNNKRQAPSPPEKLSKNREKLRQSDPSKYLQSWAAKMRLPPTSAPAPVAGDTANLEESVVELVKNQKGEYEIHQPRPGNIPQKVMEELKRLYGEKKEEAKMMVVEQKRTEQEVKKITEDLSNVDLD